MTWLKNLSGKQTATVLFWAGLAVVILTIADTNYPASLILVGFALMLPAPTFGLLHAANYRKATS